MATDWVLAWPVATWGETGLELRHPRSSDSGLSGPRTGVGRVV